MSGRGWRPSAPKVGIFGKVGAGNIGNDASMEAVLRYLNTEYPQAVVEAMCTGPETVRARYGVAAVALFWHHNFRNAPRVAATALKILGTGVDVFRTLNWVRRQDVVIVPGAGVLEASLPMVPRGFPYALFLLSVSGRIFGTRVALVSVGAGRVNQPVTRWLFNSAARLAFYRSYRDAGALQAMRARGIDVRRDHVYTDLAFSIPVPPQCDGDARTVAVGVMEYSGTNDERPHADEIYSSYVDSMKGFVRWLVDSGRHVRLIVGDTNGSDDSVVELILSDLRERRPDLLPGSVIAERVSSFSDVMDALRPVGSVVAIRYHNLVCALKLCKPTISISYSPKHDVLMADMGLAEFCEPVSGLDVERLIDLFGTLEKRSDELRQVMLERNEAKEQAMAAQFEALSAVVFAPRRPRHMAAVKAPAAQGSARKGDQ